MAAGTTAIADVIVPEVFGSYTQQITEEKSRLIQSGVVARDPSLDAFLAGPGLTMHSPSWRDLDNDPENISSDVTGTSTPNKIQATDEMVVRLSRNNSWATADLTGVLAGSDPAQAIADRVGAYWVRRMQAAFVATMKGVFADNAAAPTGTEHTLNDMTVDIKGASFVDGVTNFSAGAFVDANFLMGDSYNKIDMIMCHSLVLARMVKNNLIDYVLDSEGNLTIPTFMGKEVIVDDGMPVSGGVFESWLFGRGAFRMGMGAPKVPTEVDRLPAAGNGGGQEILYNRVEWCMHPEGCSYVGVSPAKGGPSNAATTSNLAHADSWKRSFTERKMVRMARLITREF